MRKLNENTIEYYNEPYTLSSCSLTYSRSQFRVEDYFNIIQTSLIEAPSNQNEFYDFHIVEVFSRLFAQTKKSKNLKVVSYTNCITLALHGDTQSFD